MTNKITTPGMTSYSLYNIASGTMFRYKGSGVDQLYMKLKSSPVSIVSLKTGEIYTETSDSCDIYIVKSATIESV